MSSLLLMLPKYIWNYIIDYLSHVDISKLSQADNSIYAIINDGNCKRFFIENRTNAIAVVKCPNNNMQDFWKHCYHKHIVCVDIPNIFDIISAEQTEALHYKVFIGPGEHNISGIDTWYDCSSASSIEIIGSLNDSKTIICSNTTKISRLNLVISPLFTISNIVFNNVGIVLNHRHPNAEFVTYHQPKDLHIKHCVFDTAINYIRRALRASITVNLISNVIIDNITTTFTDGLKIINIDVSEKQPRCDIIDPICYSITNSVFDCDGCVINTFLMDMPTKIILSGNTLDAPNILQGYETSNFDIILKNNTITNAKYLMYNLTDGISKLSRKIGETPMFNLIIDCNIIDNLHRLAFYSIHTDRIRQCNRTTRNKYINCG